MIHLERLYDNSPASRNFDKLAQMVIDMGANPTTGAPRDIGIRFGSVDVTSSASVTGSASVDHGLGRAPAAAFACAVSSNGVVNCTVNALADSTFTVVTRYTDDTPRSTTVAVFWVVIG